MNWKLGERMMLLILHMTEMRKHQTNFLGLKYFPLYLINGWNVIASVIAEQQVLGTDYQSLMYLQGRGFRTYRLRQNHSFASDEGDDCAFQYLCFQLVFTGKN